MTKHNVTFGRDGVVRYRRKPIGTYVRHTDTWTYQDEDYRKGLLVTLDDGTVLAEEYDHHMRREVEDHLRRCSLPSREEQAALLRDYLATVAASAPEGTVIEQGEGWHDGWHSNPQRFDGDVAAWLLAVSADGQCRVAVSAQYDGGCVGAHGHTLYRDAEGTWRTFTRRGIEDSFYDDNGSQATTLLPTQLQRAAAKRERSKADVGKWLVVPGAPVRLHQDRLPTVQADLAVGGTVTLAPNGFGTALMISGRARRGWQRNAAVAKALGVPRAWTTQADWD